MLERILALDYGHKRVGVAMSDPTGTLASPYPALLRDGQFWSKLTQMVLDFEVAKIIVGLPIKLDGSEGEAAKNVRQFAGQLEQRLKKPVELFDERLTSKQANRLMIDGGVRREKRRDLVDSVSASLLLQTYMSAQSLPKIPSED